MDEKNINLDDERKRKIGNIELAKFIIGFAAFCMGFILVFSSSWLAKHVFSYEVKESYVSQEAYDHIVGTVDTYVCYTTDYGEKYHAAGCGSLWNSSHKTTVYHAQKRGYDPCAKCTPTERTVADIVETRYRDVEQTRTVTKTPTLRVFFVGVGSIAVVSAVSIGCLTLWKRKLEKQIEKSTL